MPVFTQHLRQASVSLPELLQTLELHRSERLFLKDQPAAFAYFVFDGLVKLHASAQTAGQPMILDVSGRGMLIGEQALAQAESVYDTDAVAMTDAVVLKIPHDAFKRGLANLMGSFIGRLLEQNLELCKRAELLCLRDVEFRIVHYLARLSKFVPSSEDGYKIPITQRELAAAICAARETTSTTLNRLERRGLLKLARSNVVVLPSLLAVA